MAIETNREPGRYYPADAVVDLWRAWLGTPVERGGAEYVTDCWMSEATTLCVETNKGRLIMLRAEEIITPEGEGDGDH